MLKHHQLLRFVLLAGMLGFSAMPLHASESGTPFYKAPALFSTQPKAVHKFTQSINRCGPVGIGIELTQPAFGMKIKNVEPGSPAAMTKKLRSGQIIESINGEVLKDIDPRIQLGRLITKAEATDGNVTLVVLADKQSKPEKVTVTIPVLGAYSKTWPLDCSKSDHIVRALAQRLTEEGHDGSIGLDGPKILFLLSTGEKKDLEVVKGWMKKIVERNNNFGEGTVYQWHVAWGAPPIAEYYLRTGDASVLPLMKRIADGVRKNQYQGGWGGRGLAGHHMGLAGTGTLTFLLLAKQCGVDVDEGMLQSALTHYYRFAGRGTNPYMDAFPESTFTDNGRNGLLAFAMAAASRLNPKGESSLYAKARDISAIKSFYSTSYMLHGHTGGGIGEVWRSASMGLMAETQPHHYREFMTQRMWFYDLSRRYDGSFGIIDGGDRYDNPSWGITMGLTYTAPRKKLCIFGAPRSQYAKVQDAAPDRCWGNASDDAFLSLAMPTTPEGKIRNIDDESVVSETGVAVDRKMARKDITDEDILKYIYHREHRFREKAAWAIGEYQRHDLILPLLQDKDPRVRNAGVMACRNSLFTDSDKFPEFPVEKVKARLFDMLNDPNEAWFTTAKVLHLLAGFSAEDLFPHADRLSELLGHQEWWIRHKALEAAVPLALNKETYAKTLVALEKHLPNFIRLNWQFPKRLREQGLDTAPPEIHKALAKALGKVYLTHPGPKAINPLGGVRPHLEERFAMYLAYTMEMIPGGLETLFEVSRQRFPDKKLPHRSQFMSGTTMTIENEDLKEAITTIITEDLIPQQIGKELKALKAFAEAKSENSKAMAELQALYSQAGIMDFDWKPYGPQRNEMTWAYYSFDPPEKWSGVSDRLGRYRKVTFPEGMDNWFAPEFDPKAMGWKCGLAPFGSADGKKGYVSGATDICALSFCGCGEPINTLWEKDVLLLRGSFELPPLEKGYAYRLLHGGISHVGLGGGYRVYVNGKLFIEDKKGIDRRAGGQPRGRVITEKWWPEFSKGKVTLAGISFMKTNLRSKKFGGNFSLFLQRMKIPSLDANVMDTVAKATPLLTSEWQTLQDPGRDVDPEEGTFNWNGTFVPNPNVLGIWKAVTTVKSIDDFVPGSTESKGRLPFSQLVFKEKGRTANEQWIWSGEVLMDLVRNQALRMSVKTIHGVDYLFVEEGGFSEKQPVGWECPFVVLKK